MRQEMLDLAGIFSHRLLAQPGAHCHGKPVEICSGAGLVCHRAPWNVGLEALVGPGIVAVRRRPPPRHLARSDTECLHSQLFFLLSTYRQLRAFTPCCDQPTKTTNQIHMRPTEREYVSRQSRSAGFPCRRFCTPDLKVSPWRDFGFKSRNLGKLTAGGNHPSKTVARSNQIEADRSRWKQTGSRRIQDSCHNQRGRISPAHRGRISPALAARSPRPANRSSRDACP